MDSSQLQQSYERRPPYPRTASRSSTSTTNTRITSQSANSSTSHIPPSPQLSSSHSLHRYHHTQCAVPGSPRGTPRATGGLSREASAESTRQTAVSSFLQEKLQRERKAESDKLTKRSNTDMSASVEMGRAVHSSPIKGSDSDARRPQSAAGVEKKKGLGVKDMEQVISSLHKQNFDLKLELYHRRERQTTLEERVEALENDKIRAEDLNEKLVLEMEQRDKAIEEAVAMIVTLEAKLEQFAKERDMVRHIEAESQYSNVNVDPFEHATPKASRALEPMRMEDEFKSLARMPSFLSDRSENTENLRNVYLGVRGSVLSLPQVVEGSGDIENPTDALASPSLSVLSESSFVSVYGQKAAPPDVDEPLELDGVSGLPAKAQGISRPKTALAKPAQMNRAARSNSLTAGRGQFQSITNVVDGSPLQRIERWERGNSKKDELRPQSRDQETGVPLSSHSSKSPGRTKTREEKREALRKVLTDAPGGVRLHDHALPPTPDTISTSTLRRFQNSNDTLSKQQGLVRQRSIGALSNVSAQDETLEERPEGVLLNPEPPKSKTRDFSDDSFFENRPMIQRPRSAGETTVSHRRDNDWMSDSDDDSDTRSLESSLDIWMRESAKPNGKGRGSPDLFGFPSGAKGGWNMDAMFGDNTTYGATTINPEQLLEMFPVQQTLFGPSAAPPPPNRRSSLHARTGSSSGCQTMKSGVRKSPAGSRRHRYPRSRRNSDDPQMRANLKTPVQQSQPPPAGEQKKNHYPPIAGQQTGRNPLAKLFRRSLSGAVAPSPAPEQQASEAVVDAPTIAAIPRSQTAIPRSQTTMGIPSWVNRNALIDDDRESATPPPIMRNGRHARGVSVEMDLAIPATPVKDVAEPETPPTVIQTETLTPEQQGNSPRVVSATGARRKWLPAFGRNSVKNKTG